jgi:hypothetical protein
VAGEQVLDLFGRDVLAVADDDVLGAPGHDEIVVVHPCAQVAGGEVAVGVEATGRVVGMQVADQHLRSAGVDLTGALGRRGVVGEPDVGDPGAAVGVGRVVDVAGVGHADGGHGHLGRAVHPGHHRVLESACSTADQRR